MTRALTATLTALCIASYISLPSMADGATSTDASSITTSSDSLPSIINTAGVSSAVADSDGTSASTANKLSPVNDSVSTSTISNQTKDASNSSSSLSDGNDKKALADNSKNPNSSPAANSTGKPGAKSGYVSKPERLAAFTAGVFVGAPIAIVRRTHIEFMQGEHDLVGDFDTWWKKVLFVFPGAVMSVPFSGVSGGLGGCMYAVKNAWTGSRDEPFGKESFSLGDIGN